MKISVWNSFDLKKGSHIIQVDPGASHGISYIRGATMELVKFVALDENQHELVKRSERSNFEKTFDFEQFMTLSNQA